MSRRVDRIRLGACLLLLVGACRETVWLGDGAESADAGSADGIGDRTPVDGQLDGQLGGKTDGQGDRAQPTDRRPWDQAGFACQPSRWGRARSEAAEVIVALDHGASMAAPFDGSNRLSAARRALRAVIGVQQYAVRFGYQEFPAAAPLCSAGGSCCATEPIIPPIAQAARAIDGAMRSCDGATSCFGADARPIADSLSRDRELFARSLDRREGRFVLLVTDGDPTCGGAGSCNAAVGEVSRLAAIGVTTMVVGLGEAAATSSCLDRLASVGGAPPASPNRSHHAAFNNGQLDMALKQLLTPIAAHACRIGFDFIGTPETTVLFLDGVLVPRDERNGWSFLPGSRVRGTLNGTWCSRLQSSTTRDLDVAFDCDPR